MMLPGKATHIELERLQKAIEAAGTGIWEANPQTKELIWSAQCYQLFGITTPKPVTFEIFYEAIHPDDRQQTSKAVEEALSKNKEGIFEVTFRVIGIDDGVLRWLKSTGKVYTDDNGVANRFTGTATDITQQKVTEQQIAESEERFRNMADNAPVMIWMTDDSGYCTYLNKKWLEFTGQTMEEGAGLGWIKALHPEDQENAKSVFLKADEKQTAFQVEYRLLRADGTYRWMLDSAQPRRDKNGSYLGYIGSVLDISERKETEEALRFRTALLEAQNESTSSGLLIVDTKGGILFYNRRFAQIWQMPQQIIDNRDDYAALAHAMTLLKDPEAFINRVNYLYQHPDKPAFDEVHLTNGTVLERWGRRVIGPDETIYGYIWQFEDITERRAVRKELELRTALLEAQNEASPLGLLVINEHKEVQYFNLRYAELFQLPKELVLQKSRESLLQYFKKIIINYDSFLERINYLYQNPDAGSTDELLLYDGRIIERYGYPIKGGQDKYYGWTWQFRDITLKRKAEEQLQEKNRQLQTLIQEFKFVTDFMPQMVWTTLSDGYHDFFNKGWYDFSGLNYEETKANGWSRVLHPEDLERTYAVWRHSLQTGDVYEMEYRMRRHDGMYRWFLARAIPMRNEEGKILKWFGTCTDIHDQKLATDILEQKVQERTREIQEANKNLERSNQELEQFAFVASHDLQEPLRKIRTFTSVMQQELEHTELQKIKRYTTRILDSASRMQNLIKDLLDLSRLNYMKDEKFEPIPLNEIVKNVLADLDVQLTNKGGRVIYTQLPVIEASRFQMNQLFLNLISNALKFTRAGVPPLIQISSSLLDEAAINAHGLQPARSPFYQITVSDNGIGFQEKYARQIFTIFQRLHARSAYDGTGIGLALCKKVALNHHGDIYATGREGEGASFHILLPQKQR